VPAGYVAVQPVLKWAQLSLASVDGVILDSTGVLWGVTWARHACSEQPLPGHFGGGWLLLNASITIFHSPFTGRKTFRNFPWSVTVCPLASAKDIE